MDRSYLTSLFGSGRWVTFFHFFCLRERVPIRDVRLGRPAGDALSKPNRKMLDASVLLPM
jgi:hypothetical protein